MDCKQLIAILDDYLDGSLPEGENRLADAHLADCQDCQAELRQLQGLRHALRSLPVPAPSPGFTDNLLGQVRQQQKQRERRKRALPLAMAASLLLSAGLLMFQAGKGPVELESISLAVDDTRQVSLVFNAPADFKQVTLQLSLNGNIELAGYVGQRELEWQSSLKKGQNTLVLPIRATGRGQGELVARILHGDKVRHFRIPFNMNVPGVSVTQTNIRV